MVDFSELLSKGDEERINRVSAEMSRLYDLPDRWLGEEILRLCRRARHEDPQNLGDPLRKTYDTALVWQAGPEIARRLGATRLQTNEATDPRVMSASGEKMRFLAGMHLANSGMSFTAHRLRDRDDRVMAHDVLGHEFVNGNPLAMAVDRIADPAPKGADGNDWLARHMREISMARFGHNLFASWSPNFQVYGDPEADAPFCEVNPDDPFADLDERHEMLP